MAMDYVETSKKIIEGVGGRGQYRKRDTLYDASSSGAER